MLFITQKCNERSLQKVSMRTCQSFTDLKRGLSVGRLFSKVYKIRKRECSACLQ